MLSPLTRRLTTLAGVLFLALGAAMFVAPHWAARSFPWEISPFVAMTMGAWYLGTGVFALECVQIRRFGTMYAMFVAPHSAARRFPRISPFLAMTIGPWYRGRGVLALQGVRIRRLATIYAALLYVWLFGLLESLVVVFHGGDLELGQALAWPYLIVLIAGLLATAAGIADFARTRPSLSAPGARNPAVFRVLSAAFVVVVSLLALPLLDGYESSQRVWPVSLTLASARSFAAFFGALALSAVAVTFTRDLAPVLIYLRTAIFLNTVVLVAALVFIETFDFSAHPGQLLYVGLYVIALVGTATMIAFGRRRAVEPPALASRAYADATN